VPVGVCTSGPPIVAPAKTLIATVLESPVAVPPAPEKAGVVSFVELPSTGAVSVTAGAMVSVPAAAKWAWTRACASKPG
jgi:hypothetical protein